MVQNSLTQKINNTTDCYTRFFNINALGTKKSKTTFYLGSPFPENHVFRKYWSFYGTIFLTCEGVQKLNTVHKRFKKFRTKTKNLVRNSSSTPFYNHCISEAHVVVFIKWRFPAPL
jgi:hypothetical protein